MKKTFLKVVALFALVVSTAASALAQGSFAYQAVIRTTDGKVVSKQKVGMQFTLSSNKTVYYVEKQTPTTNEYGNVSVMIGAGTKVSGDFMTVPWNSMNVMLKIEVDAKGGESYIELGEIQLQPVPYAMYAKQAGGAKQAVTASPDDAIFEVKDKDGQVIFAVYPDGVKVYVDDSEDAPKAKRSGLIVTGRSSKDDEDSDFFVVNAEGTQIFIDDNNEATDKAKRSGLIVTGRSSKDDNSGRYLAIDGEGTHIYVDDDVTTDKAKRSGLVVTGRSSKDGGSADLFKIDDKGTQIFIDDANTDKAKRSGLVVTGRSATKDGENADYFAVNAEGTQVIVDTMDSSKAKRSGLVVTGRPASKDGEPVKVLAIDLSGTKVYIDDTPSQDKAKRSGFVVTGRPASKDGEVNEYLAVTPESIDFSSSSFNVSDKGNGNKVLSVENGNVHVNSDMLLTGEIGKVITKVESVTSVSYANMDIAAEYVFRLIDNAVIAPENSDPLFFNEKGEYVSYDDAVVVVYESEGKVRFDFTNSYDDSKEITIRFAVQSENEYTAYSVTIPAN